MDSEKQRLKVIRAQRDPITSCQTCKVCGRPTGFNWHVPDVIWEEIVPKKYGEHMVCLVCFDQFAYERGVDYAPYLSDFVFAGDQASFIFDVAKAISIFGLAED